MAFLFFPHREYMKFILFTSVYYSVNCKGKIHHTTIILFHLHFSTPQEAKKEQIVNTFIQHINCNVTCAYKPFVRMYSFILKYLTFKKKSTHQIFFELKNSIRTICSWPQRRQQKL